MRISMDMKYVSILVLLAHASLHSAALAETGTAESLDFNSFEEIAGASSLPQVVSLSLRDAIIAAYKNNQGWSAAQTDNKSADIKYEMHQKMFLPDIAGFVDITHKRDNHSEYSRDEVDMRTKEKDRNTGTQVGIRATQNIFNGFSTMNSMKASGKEAKAAQHKLAVDEQKLVLSVIEAYANIWFFLQKVAALQKKENNFLAAFKSQESSLEAGVATSSEVATAKANHQKAVFERINAQTELLSARAEFEKITGKKAPEKVRLPNIAFDLPKTLHDLTKLVLKNNGAIIAAKLHAKAAVDTLNSTRGNLAPSCDLTLSAARNLNSGKEYGLPVAGKVAESKTKQRSMNYTAQLGIKIPIYYNSEHRGNTYSQIGLANQAALRASFVAKDTELEVKRECEVTWHQYIATNAMIEASRSAVRSAKISSESNIKEMALGMKSNSDLWIKENSLLESRVDLANSQKQRLIAAVKLLSLSGTLSFKFMLDKLQKKSVRKTSVIEATLNKAQAPAQITKQTPQKAIMKAPVSNVVKRR